jgi:hypothetical protein
MYLCMHCQLHDQVNYFQLYTMVSLKLVVPAFECLVDGVLRQ